MLRARLHALQRHLLVEELRLQRREIAHKGEGLVPNQPQLALMHLALLERTPRRLGRCRAVKELDFLASSTEHLRFRGHLLLVEAAHPLLPFRVARAGLRIHCDLKT